MIDSSVTIKRGCGVLFVLLLQETGEQQRQQMKYRSKSAPIRWKEGDCVKSSSTCEPDSYPSQEKNNMEETKLPEGSMERPCLVLLIRESHRPG
mmetsp:Transcript_39609/g.45251  ORF Transcript_39609/g.45251 Transcript_39609/m.45251 type:complete len:94 (-) Transcript_39609:394-675(-)